MTANKKNDKWENINVGNIGKKGEHISPIKNTFFYLQLTINLHVFFYSSKYKVCQLKVKHSFIKRNL